MGRSVDVDDLLSAAEVAELIGLSHLNSVTTYLHRYDEFPRPVVERSGGRIRLWVRQDIVEWQRVRYGDG